MPELIFYTPKLIIQNITSNKEVTIMNLFNLKAGQTVDVFKAVAPGSLREDYVLGELFNPEGDLYREVVEKKSLKVLEIDLPSFHYSLVKPSNIISSNTFLPNAFPLSIDGSFFRWVQLREPLFVSVDNELFMSQASPSTDGWLSKEDYVLFASVAAGGDFVIWQYQDFIAPVSTSLTLNTFANGSGLGFNAAYILDNTAVATLSSNSEAFPTTTLSIPGVWLPSNRVSVGSHIGTTVILNQEPDPTLSIRVYYQISLPAGVKPPSGYVESPNFVNEREIELLDDFFINQAGDETIYGAKTFETIVTSSFSLSSSPVDGYVLTTDALGNGSWQPVGAATETTASNVGGGGVGVFKQKVGNELQFRNIGVDGYGLNISLDSDVIQLSANVRQLVNLINGPFEGFISGTFREISPEASPFPELVTWWDSPIKNNKIIEKEIIYGGSLVTPPTIVWRLYDADGLLVLTATDTLAYNGIFEHTRTRVLS